MIRVLVGGRPTPLKNDGVRQWGWDDPKYEMENNKCSKPPTRSNQTFSCGWQTLSCSLATH